MDKNVKHEPDEWTSWRQSQEHQNSNNTTQYPAAPPPQPWGPPPPSYQYQTFTHGQAQAAVGYTPQNPPTWSQSPPGYAEYGQGQSLSWNPQSQHQYERDTKSGSMPSPQQYFFICSQLNNLVLDVRGANVAPGTEVITFAKNLSGNDNQLWWQDVEKGTICSKLNGFCMEITGGNTLVVRPYEQANGNQKFRIVDDVIHVNSRPGHVLDIKAACRDSGASILSYKHHGKNNQKWKIQPVDQYGRDLSVPPLFYIRSDLNHKVLDVAGENKNPGAKVIMYQRKPKRSLNQMWCTDEKGIIKSALNNFAIDTSGGCAVLQPYSASKPHQQWRIAGRVITNANFPGKCLDIKACKFDDGAEIISYQDKGQANQLWHQDFN